ncbi:MAG: hypothetical protein AB3N21_11565 [Ruegeria sp.]|uniref:hypothetical protein n=1 Tax=Ruegeria sp. TaxID=1879320 RepID=UPI00349E4BE1
MSALRPILSALLAALFALPALAAELVMVEQAGCSWCTRWNAEIAPAYPKTPEGRFAPLRRVDLHALPADLELQRRVVFTPTFLIVEDGQEVGRLEGYPGQDFFWPVLDQLLEAHTEFELTPTNDDSAAVTPLARF